MTNEKIIEMLKKPVKPDLEGIKKYCLENGDSVFGISNAKKVRHWAHAGTVTAGLSMIARKFHPERNKTNREAFYRRGYSHFNNDKIDKAMRKAGVEEWQKGLPKDSPYKKLPWDSFQFYLNECLGSQRSTQQSMKFYEGLNWDATCIWPNEYETGVERELLNGLMDDDEEAVKLSEFGYQNVLVIDNETVVFIKLPAAVWLDVAPNDEQLRPAHRRVSYVLSSTEGAAKVSVSGRREFWYKGLHIQEQNNRWGSNRDFEKVPLRTEEAMFMQHFDKGVLKSGVKDILKEPVEAFRHMLLKDVSKEDIQNAFTLNEAINQVTDDVALRTILEAVKSEDVRSTYTIQQIITFPKKKNHIQTALLEHFTTEEICCAYSLDEAVNKVEGAPLMTILSNAKTEDVKAKFTIKGLLIHENAEVRRVLLKHFDPEEILEVCDAKLISSEVDKLPCSCNDCAGKTGMQPTVNELFSVDIGLEDSYRMGDPDMGDKTTGFGKYKNRAKMLRYKCTSTDRVYAKFVPFNIKTANEGQAWSHHFTLNEYLNELAAQS